MATLVRTAGIFPATGLRTSYPARATQNSTFSPSTSTVSL